LNNIFLDNLPKKLGFGANKNKECIDWVNSIGYKVKFIYDDIEGEVEIIDYCKENKQLIIKYNNNFSINTSNFINCKLGVLLNIIIKDYKYQIGEILINKFGKIKILKQIKIKTGNKNHKGYKYECLIDGNIDEILETDLNQERGCNVCCVPSKKVLKGYNDLWTTHPHIAKLLKYHNEGHKFSFGSNKSKIFVCPDCGYEKNIAICNVVNHGFPCTRCGDGISYPNKFAFSLLEQLEVDFIPEYNPEWIKPKRYDFYFELNDNKYILEMDGNLGHGKENPLSNQTAEESKAIDNYKDELAKEHGIKVIRIDCLKSDLEYIKNNILISRLNDLFILSHINWLKCKEFASSNRLKEACNLWNSGMRSTVDIGKLMKLCRNTICRYLKNGANIGFCDYNSKEAKKGIGRNSGLKKKVIQLTKDNEFIKEWDGLTDIEKELNIDYTNISTCCRGRIKYIYGFKWMYKVDYEEYIKQKSESA